MYILVKWSKITFTNPTNIAEIMVQPICYNHFIKINDQVIVYQDLYNVGIQRIENIVNRKEKQYYTLAEARQIYGPNFNYLHYYSLINAIPKEWANSIKTGNASNVITYLDKCESMKKISKWIYQLEITRSNNKRHYRDAARIKWNIELQIDILEDQWQNIRLNPFRLLISTKIQEFQYRFLSNRITTNQMRNRYDSDVSPFCDFCQKKIETVQHVFWECQEVAKFWKLIQRWCQYMLKIPTTSVTRDHVFFCNYVGQYEDFVNTVLMIIKQYIYATKCSEQKQLSYAKCMSKIRTYYLDEQYYARQNNKNHSFVKKMVPI